MTSPSTPWIRRAQVVDFGPIGQAEWCLPTDQGGPGWHVILGDNGSGKTSLLKAVSLALLGQDAALSLRIVPSDYIRRDKPLARVVLDLVDEKRTWESRIPTAKGKGRMAEHAAKGFHASFGSARRFLGGVETARLESSSPDAARHASLFDPNWSLGDLVQWLKDLRLEEVDGVSGQDTLASVRTFLNQPDLLPGMELVDVRRQGPIFRDTDGLEHGIEALSDGYQSAVGLTLEILRQLFEIWPVADAFEPQPDGSIVVGVPGLVLIDEIDAHLHPTWQQRIGFFFTEHFPRFQFLVTTHSPLVCRAAERGSIFRLPRPGSDEEARMITGQARDRLLFGDVLDAYGTEVFGEDVTRSALGQKKLDELAQLNVKARFGQLADEERHKQERLQNLLLEVPDE